MGKKLFNLSSGMELGDAPLIYLHEEFKKHNKKNHEPLKNNWVWFSKENLETIRKMIEEIDVDGKKIKGDGVRLYYGIYNQQVCDHLNKLPDPEDGTSRDYSDHKGHNTVFFVPTYKGAGQDEHIDGISPENVKKFRENYEQGQDLPEPFMGGFDVGHICPPPKDCDSSGSIL